ncbi:MAG TPA: pyridoxal phosphate-dependent aminotransferase [candidate division Zixibacteria bacterium]|nr:pyridoxal phosphate-dependent aminotransferase [candidate division Zixibacteria bacterium]
MPVKKVIIEKANRLYQLPLDLESYVSPRREHTLIKRTELIDLARFKWPVSISDHEPFEATSLGPASVAELSELKEAIADWYGSVHGVRLNPRSEIILTGGSSRTVMDLGQAFIDYGDVAFVPDLGWPVYRAAVVAAGGETVGYSVSPKNNWHPDFARLSTRLGRVARLLFVNSPHNPTGAELNEREMANLVWLAGRENIFVINDAAYQNYAERKSVSLLSVVGGRKVGAEMASMAFFFGLPPMPLGFVAGSKEIIAGLEHVQRYQRPFFASAWVQMALSAIRKYPSEGLSQVRKDGTLAAAEASKLLDKLNLERQDSDTTPFIWARIEKRTPSARATRVLFRQAKILVLPGIAFGENGEGFLRLSLTAGASAYEAAVESIVRKKRIIRLGDST